MFDLGYRHLKLTSEISFANSKWSCTTILTVVAISWSVNIPNPVTCQWSHAKLSLETTLYNFNEKLKTATRFLLSLSFSNIVICWKVINITAITILETEWQQDTTSCVIINWKLDWNCTPVKTMLQFSKCISDVISDMTMTLNAYCCIAVLDVCVEKKWNGYEVHSPPSCLYH